MWQPPTKCFVKWPENRVKTVVKYIFKSESCAMTHHRANWVVGVVDMFTNQIYASRNLHEESGLDRILASEKI